MVREEEFTRGYMKRSIFVCLVIKELSVVCMGQSDCVCDTASTVQYVG